ncbi:MAG TPA: hypothetical protein VHJ58_02440 [Vicinamibacterales bacterium]|jgi:hypothetical protein|nr:hypothetical protein [Vicinamibacterales bacterium]
MFETYRMLGREHEAELIREAEKLARGAAVRRTAGSGRRRYRLQALAALVEFGSRRPAEPEPLPRDGRRPA